MRFPQAKWIQWEPAGRHNARAGSQLAFGEYVDAAVRHREGRRHPFARRRLPLHGGVGHPPFARVRLAPPARGRSGAAQSFLRRRKRSHQHRLARRSSAAVKGERDRELCACRCVADRRRGRGRSHGSAGGDALDRSACQGPPGQQGPQPGDCRRRTAGDRSWARACHERRARQRRRHRHLHADGRSAANRSARRAPDARQRHERGNSRFC